MHDVVPKAKYLFEQDFAPGASQAEKAVAAAEHALKLAEAEAQGFRNGFDTAEREGHSVAERRTAAAFEQIGGAIERFASRIAAAEQRIEAEAIELAVAIASLRRSWCSASRSARSRRLQPSASASFRPRRT
jgi:flagellar assembly protein FliH